MKKMVLGPVGTLFMIAVSMGNPALGAELLDVKPVILDSGVVVEVTADIPMTYTYYKVPGQARAVVDIADADPEKVEPLIVVNKGALSSISVDKATIEGMTVSRLVFNLVSESEITVKQEPGRKKLLVSFTGGKPVSSVGSAPAVSATPVPLPEALPEPEKKVSEVASQTPATSLSKEEEDPLGLDEPQTAAAAVAVVEPEPSKTVVVTAAPVASLPKEEEDPLGLEEPNQVAEPAPTPVAARSAEVVADTTDLSSSTYIVKGVGIGASFIVIQTNGNVDKIKHLKLSNPGRLVIDLPGVNKMKVNSIAVNKFGISKVRIGTTPGVVRIVLDASRSTFPDYSIGSAENGIRIDFK
jgi:hypothetical protein